MKTQQIHNSKSENISKQQKCENKIYTTAKPNITANQKHNSKTKNMITKM